MRLTIDKEQLLKAVNVAGKAAAASSPTPILNNLRLKLDETGLEVLGRNGKIAIKYFVPIQIDDKVLIRDRIPGETCVNAATFASIVRKTEGELFTLEVVDDSIAKIDIGKFSAKLNCISAEEYPDLDLEDNGASVELACADLAALVEQTAFAASVKMERATLTALHLEAAEGVLEAVATDSARLAKKVLPISEPVRFVCNVPARTALDVVRMFENEERVVVSVSESQIVFEFGNTLVASRLVEGEYPSIKSIVPTAFSRYLEVNSAELQRIMELVSIFSVEHDSVVKLNLSEEEVVVSSKGTNSGSSSQTLTVYQYSGEPLSISFNSTYVVDALKGLKAEDVQICFQGEMKPFVIKNPKDDSVVELLTPVRTY